MTIVIGGGFYGAILAETLAKQGEKVTLLEQDAQLMQRASRINQARVHQGYHYPRALLTARRSRVNYAAFMRDFASAVEEPVDSFYAIARIGSKVTAQQFRLFCQRIEAPLEPAPSAVRQWFQSDRIEEVFRVKEAVYHPGRLREIMEQRLSAAGVDVRFNTMAIRLIRKNPSGWTVDLASGSGFDAERVYLCGYAGLNALLQRSNLPLIPMNQEWTEMAVVELPQPLRQAAITVMCGPFFSVMPYPPSPGLHTLSHVRYTPHAAWAERDSQLAPAAPALMPSSHFPYMVRDAARYVPLLKEAVYRESLWQMKSILPASDVDDSRPILYRRDHGGPGLTCILGGKIDNVYDMQQELSLVPR